MDLGDTHRNGYDSHEYITCVWAWGSGTADTEENPPGYSLPSPLWGTSLEMLGEVQNTLSHLAYW